MADDAPALAGQPGTWAITLEITRAATGLTETVDLVGTLMPDSAEDDE